MLLKWQKNEQKSGWLKRAKRDQMLTRLPFKDNFDYKILLVQKHINIK